MLQSKTQEEIIAGNPAMYEHFSHVALSYRHIRRTDPDPILFISEILKDYPRVKAADVGCGAGRYDLLLFQHLNNLHLTCIDVNESMLQQVAEYLTHHQCLRFQTLRANGNDIPLEDHSLDCVFTFNAIHHFDLIQFVRNAVRLLKTNGNIFMYTRLRSQNAGNIWGQYFPFFLEKETRLHEMDEIEETIRSIGGVKVKQVKSFHYQRKATIQQLVEKVHAKHYSTFSLYTEDELKNALAVFQTNLKNAFPHTVEWMDENTLFVLAPTAGCHGQEKI